MKRPLLALSASLALALPAVAVETGDTCKVRSTLAITMKGASGTLRATIDPGTTLEVLSVGDQGFSRVRAGEMVGSVSTLDLESACSGALRMCKLATPVQMFEETRSDSKAYLLKEGAALSVLKRGKTWAAVRIEDLTGFVKSEDIQRSCVVVSGVPESRGEGGGDAQVEAVERGEGPGLLLGPFHLEGAAPAGPADALLDTLFDRAAFFRPDAGRVGLEGKRDLPWKKQVEAAAKRARGAEMAFALAGSLSVESPSKEDPLTERYLLQLAVVDAKTGKVLKGARVRPTLNPEDDWADRALAVLLPTLPTAPGARLPTPPPQKTELQPLPEPAPAAPTAPVAPAEERPGWYANAWGYLALGAAAAVGTAAGVVGWFALGENDEAAARVQTDPARPAQQQSALTLAITSDALTVTAGAAALTGVILFATGAGLPE